jgi:hypothetical protein
MKDASAKSRKKANQMLKQVQKHDMAIRFWSFCHPEPGPELNSGSTISGSRFWVDEFRS